MCGAVLCIGGVFISSYLKSKGAFIFFYAILFGLGVGVSYFIPLMCGWEWLPNNRGFVSGFIVGGYGFGSFFFGLLAMYLVNPNNEKPIDYEGEKIYPKEIADNVPKMLRVLCGCWVGLFLLGVFLVRRNPKYLMKERRDSE